jgi:hypothetical protein
LSRDTWRPGDGQEAALEVLDGVAHAAQDFVPTMDQEIPVASHCDWDPAKTRIVTCRIANDVYTKDERFETRAEAYAAITLRHGKIREANYVPGRAFFRVDR